MERENDDVMQITESKVQVLCGRLKELALKKGPDAKLPTMRELCLSLETSRVTLGEALELLEAQNILYRRHGSGIYVSPKVYRKTICVLLYSRLFLSKEASPFWGLLWGFLAQEAQRRAEYKNEYCSFHFVVDTPGQELGLPEDVAVMIQSGKVHGVLAIGLDEETYKWLTEREIPIVSFAGPGTVIVGTNTKTRVELAVSHLIEQGCRRLGLWMPIDYVMTEEIAQSRLLSEDEIEFRASLQKLGLAFDPELRRLWMPDPSAPAPRVPLSQDQGYQHVMDVFGRLGQKRPDGIFITDDLVTVGAMIACQRLGIQVGEDVKIVTHANAGSQALYGYTEYLTLIEFDPAELVSTMFNNIEALMEEQKDLPQSILIESKLRTTQPR